MKGLHPDAVWRAQGIDVYSNILYVKEGQAQLSHLAHRMLAAHKFRPETCCIVGNYFSLKGDHEQVSAARGSSLPELAGRGTGSISAGHHSHSCRLWPRPPADQAYKTFSTGRHDLQCRQPSRAGSLSDAKCGCRACCTSSGP